MFYETNSGLNTISLLVFNLAIVSAICYFIINQIEIVRDTILFKNIYGIVLKQIDKNEIKKVKAVYTDVNYRLYYLFSIFGSKYTKMIQIKLQLKHQARYQFNGNILTTHGLAIPRKKLNN